MAMRLDKLLAHYGIGTRKEVKTYIRKGYVQVNGQIIKKDDFKVDYEKDQILFDGQPINYKPYIYLMLNKPSGYVSATKDNVHPTVVDLIKGYHQYDLFPVGRLDLDTEGLLLLTNDGDFAHKLLAPSRHHSKLYYAKVDGIMNQEDVQKLSNAANAKKITYLKRIQVRNLKLDENLKLGEYRELSEEELNDLMNDL